MLQIDVVKTERYDEEKNLFVTTEGATLYFEHSLFSLSKWESKWEVPFMGPDTQKTGEMMFDYLQYMLVQDSDPSYLTLLTDSQIQEVQTYIHSSQTATWFSDSRTRRQQKKEVYTAETIYYWMVALNIPFECQYWHLNRLITLVRVVELKSKPANKKNKRDTMSQHRDLNAQRRAQSSE